MPSDTTLEIAASDVSEATWDELVRDMLGGSLRQLPVASACFAPTSSCTCTSEFPQCAVDACGCAERDGEGGDFCV